MSTFDRIDAAREGDGAALGEVLETFRDYLTLVAHQRLGPGLETRAGASDLVQETFLAAQRGLHGFRGTTRAEWRAWLQTILDHRIANLRRRYLDTRKRRGEPTAVGGEGGLGDALSGSAMSPSRQIRKWERDAALEAAILRLPGRYREVIRWHHDDGLTFESIGRRLGTSADAARKLWARALVCLRRDLGPDHAP